MPCQQQFRSQGLGPSWLLSSRGAGLGDHRPRQATAAGRLVAQAQDLAPDHALGDLVQAAGLVPVGQVGGAAARTAAVRRRHVPQLDRLGQLLPRPLAPATAARRAGAQPARLAAKASICGRRPRSGRLPVPTMAGYVAKVKPIRRRLRAALPASRSDRCRPRPQTLMPANPASTHH